jgi:hypothetical protein
VCSVCADLSPQCWRWENAVRVLCVEVFLVLMLGEGQRRVGDVEVFVVPTLSEGRSSASDVAAFKAEVRSSL